MLLLRLRPLPAGIPFLRRRSRAPLTCCDGPRVIQTRWVVYAEAFPAKTRKDQRKISNGLPLLINFYCSPPERRDLTERDSIVRSTTVRTKYIYFIVICIDNDRLNINVVLRTERQLWRVFSALSSRRWLRVRSALLVDELARVDESIRDNVTGARLSAQPSRRRLETSGLINRYQSRFSRSQLSSTYEFVRRERRTAHENRREARRRHALGPFATNSGG